MQDINLIRISFDAAISYRQSQKTQQFILGNPLGEENPTKLLYYGLNQVKCQYEDLSPRRIAPTDRYSA